MYCPSTETRFSVLKIFNILQGNDTLLLKTAEIRVRDLCSVPILSTDSLCIFKAHLLFLETHFTFLATKAVGKNTIKLWEQPCGTETQCPSHRLSKTKGPGWSFILLTLLINSNELFNIAISYVSLNGHHSHSNINKFCFVFYDGKKTAHY